jgi:hypothetical protein
LARSSVAAVVFMVSGSSASTSLAFSVALIAFAFAIFASRSAS